MQYQGLRINFFYLDEPTLRSRRLGADASKRRIYTSRIHLRRCIFGSITADSTVSFSPRQAATKATSAA